jgi:(E)-4-hydroxy-3-methylbut-2-enyl-diphosphate synthase
MVYAAGKTDHTIEGGSMVDHIVELVERRVEVLKRETAEQAERDAATMQAA